jgi:hypothetical protein
MTDLFSFTDAETGRVAAEREAIGLRKLKFEADLKHSTEIADQQARLRQEQVCCTLDLLEFPSMSV